MIAALALFIIISTKERYRAENILRTREEFLSGLSDRFRAPLHRIMELSTAEEMNTEELKPASEGIRAEASQLSSMMDNLFSYSTIISSSKKTKRRKSAIPANLP